MSTNKPAHSLRHVLVAGPTASGKSAFAVELQARIGGVIVNADSMQVYGDLRILTARPSLEDERAVPHRLFGHISGNQDYSVGHWARDVAKTLGHCEATGARAIIVGGTGLYFSALTVGLAPVPEIPEAIRAHWRNLASSAPEKLLPELEPRDPLAAGRIRASDSQRLVRALEVIDATGRSLIHWQEDQSRPILNAEHWTGVVIAPSREELYQRCDARFDQMLSHGAMQEVRDLARQKLALERPIMRALGVRPLMAVDAGELTLAEARERTQTDTRRYAKRQITWLKSKMMSWTQLETHDSQRLWCDTFANQLL